MNAVTHPFCKCSGRRGFRLVGDDFVCVRCNVPQPGYEVTASGGLTFFRGGPLDGKAYETASLLDPTTAAELPVHEYRWTAEKITSQLTGQTARVWLWKGPDAAPAAPVNNGSDRTNHKESKTMAQNTSTDGLTNETLLAQRKELGLSRRQVAEQAGITQAMLCSMETSGKRVKEGVMDKVAGALAHFRSEQGKTSEPATEGHTAAE